MRLLPFFRPSFSTAAGLLLMTHLITSAHAQEPTSEASAAVSTDPDTECTRYYYAPVTDVLYNFPSIWEPAYILPNDTNAMAKWNAIEPYIPTNISVKGTQPQSLEGNFSGYSYSSSDPDCWWTYDTCTTPKYPGLSPDVAGLPEPDTLGYAFDDGPNCSHNAFYDYLLENSQKATMFYIGSNVFDWPYEAQRGLTDGHEICVHTWSHRYMTAFSSQQAFAELYYTVGIIQAIKLVVGVTPTCWRPPYGDVDDRIRMIAKLLGLYTVIWQEDSNDWKEGTDNITVQDVDDNYQYLINNATSGKYSTGGTIMLMHELNNFTMSETMTFYNGLKSAFKYLVPIGVALNQTQPYVETNYSLPTFEQYTSGELTVNTTTTSSSASSYGAQASPTSSVASSSKVNGASSHVALGSSGAVTSLLAATAVFLGAATSLLV